MGYSCTQSADNMLGVIRFLFGDKTSSNTLLLGGRSYFYEVGRENADGAITGQLLEIDGEYAKRVGGFRINPDGTIARFPRLGEQRIAQAEKVFHTTSSELLRKWSMGVI